MATVGELVKGETRPMGLAPGEHLRMVGREDIRRALRDLGIWDAEVLEGEMYYDSDRVLSLEPVLSDKGNWSSRGYSEGDRVKVFVIPQEEDSAD